MRASSSNRGHHNGMDSDKLPRFYRKPSEADVERDGSTMAEIRAQIRARILGSRAVSAVVSVSIGTAITAQEYLVDNGMKPTDLLANFAIPALVNGIAQIKIEKQLRQTGQELETIVPAIIAASPKPTNTNGATEA